MSRALNLCPSVLANLIHLAHELARALQTPGPTPTPQGRYASALPTGNEALDELLLDLDAAPQGAGGGDASVVAVGGVQELKTPQTAFHVFKYRFTVATRPAT